MFGCNHLQHPRGVEGFARQDAAPRDAVRSVRADDDLRGECPGIGFHNDTILARLDIFYRHPFSNLYSPLPGFLCQPRIELIAADDAQDMAFPFADGQPAAREIKMRRGRVRMGDLAQVQAEALEDGLRVNGQSARA